MQGLRLQFILQGLLLQRRAQKAKENYFGERSVAEVHHQQITSHPDGCH